jgi:arylsulfatase
LDETLIVFTSDHGDALGDHGLPFKGFFYDCMARVPLIIRGPGVSAGSRSASLVSTLDLVPLFYHTCDTPAPETLQGEDIRPLLADPSCEIRKAAYSEIGGRMMVRTRTHKYAHYQNGDAECYDLTADPNEITNLAGRPEMRDTEGQMKDLLIAHTLRNQAFHSAYVSAPQYWLRGALEADYKKQRASGDGLRYRPLYSK